MASLRLWQSVVCLAAVFVGLLAAVTQAITPPTRAPHYPDHRALLVVRNDDGIERPVRTAEDWAIRRRHILVGMEEVMGILPDRGKLPAPKLRVIEETPTEHYTRQRVSLPADDPLGPKGERTPAGDLVTAYLFLPKGAAGPRPGILALHPTGAPGKDIVAELGGKANRQYAAELAERGYVVVAPDYPSFGESKDYHFESDGHKSGTMKGIWNHLRCVDVLVSHPAVDRDRLGVIGHSLGGHNAMFAAVFDERLKVIVSSCGWCPFRDKGKVADWVSPRYMPELKDAYKLDANRVPFDFHEVVGALAPRPFLSLAPVKDWDFDAEGVKVGIAAAQPVYTLLGKPEALVAQYPDCDHDFPDAERRTAYAFIDRALAHQPTKVVP